MFKVLTFFKTVISCMFQFYFKFVFSTVGTFGGAFKGSKLNRETEGFLLGSRTCLESKEPIMMQKALEGTLFLREYVTYCWRKG